MHGIAILLTVVALGADPEVDVVEYGWKPGTDGQMELYIQIPPRIATTLSKGQDDLLADVPEGLPFTRIRIRVGTGDLPHDGWDPKSAATKKPDLNATQALPAFTARQTNPQFPANPRTNLPNYNAGNAAATPGSQGSSLINPPQPGEGAFDGSRFNPLSNPPAIGRNGAQPSNTGNGQFTGGRQSQIPPLSDVRQPVNGAGPLRQPANDNSFPAAQRDASAWGGNQFNDRGNPNDTTGIGARTNLRDLPPGQGFDQNAQSPWMSGPANRSEPFNSPPGYAQQGYQRNDFGPNPAQQFDRDGRPYAPGYNPYREGNPYNTVASNQQPSNTSLPLNPPATSPPANNIAATTPAPAASGAAVTPTIAAKSDARSRLDDTPAEKPWLPLTFTAMLLFASVGLNFYLGWIANGIYVRYRALLMEVRNVRAIAA